MTLTWPSLPSIFLSKLNFWLIAITLLALFAPHTVRADETLYFRDAQSSREQRALNYARQSVGAFKNTPLKIAKIDLNNDFLDEYAVKTAACSQGRLCDMLIIAFMNQSPITLLQTRAKRIIALNDHNFGVRHLRVFDIPNNDFDATIFEWSPSAYQYKSKP